MSTIKEARRALAQAIIDWLTERDEKYPTISIQTAEVKRYTTAPDSNNSQPFQIVVGTERAAASSEGVDESDFEARLFVALFARIDVNNEATKEAAEDWLDDCEGFLLEHIEASRNTSAWTSLLWAGSRRDFDPAFFRVYRTCYIRLGVTLT